MVCIKFLLALAFCLWRNAAGFQSSLLFGSNSPPKGFLEGSRDCAQNVRIVGNLFHRITSRAVSSSSSVPDSSSTNTSRLRKRDHFGSWFQNKRPSSTSNKNESKTTSKILTSVAELDEYWDATTDLKDPKAYLSRLEVHGDTQIIGSPDHADFVHPVLKILHDKRRRLQQQQQQQQIKGGVNSSEESQSLDSTKIALVVEGGGMRGCVTAGMVAALHYLGLRDCFDIVYGSSAGSVIGAYFVTGQLPWFGPELYYDELPTAGKEFIDSGRLLRALGLGLLNPKLLRDVITRPNSGKPILNLDFLLKDTLQHTKLLDWATFQERQESGVQPLKIMASALKGERPVVMDYEHGHFSTLEEMAQCMHASCLLPGITGPVMNLRTNDKANHKPKFVLRNNLNDDDYEPLADSMIYAPIAYDVARQEGATHLVVLRSKPDGGDVIGKGGSIGEFLTFSRFFLRKNKLPRMYKHMRQQRHKRWYARSVLELNEAARPNNKSKLPPTLTVALSPEYSEIARLESRREAIFEGVRSGFARAFDALVEDPAERGKGYEVAKRCFPDEILDYSPRDMGVSSSSGFESYLSKSGVWPKAWEGYSEAPVQHSSTLSTSPCQEGFSAVP